jgi:ADP-ribose pyrophosphatase YjhB (NUDIX family)
MNASEAILKLYEDFGPPHLANFALLDLTGGRGVKAGAFVLADRDGDVVLVRRKPMQEHPGLENLWWFPGGGHEVGERLDQTARREFEEETGMTVSINRFLMAHLSDEYSFIAVVFAGTVRDGMPTHQVDPDQTTAEVRLFPPSQIPFEMLWGDTQKILVVHEGLVEKPVEELIRKTGLKPCCKDLL